MVHFVDPIVLIQAAREIAEAARAEHVDAALLGGLALLLHGSDRLTRGVDFVAREVPPELDATGTSTGTLVFGGEAHMRPDGIPVQWIVRGDDYTSLYEMALDAASQTEHGFRIVRPEYLAAMKMAAHRPKDELDLLWLLRAHDLVDRDVAREIVRRHLGGQYAADRFDHFALKADLMRARDER